MAGLTELHAEGIGALTRVTREIGGDLGKRWRAEIRKAALPINADAKRRYRGLNRLGADAARTVGTSVTQKGVTVKAGGKPWSMAEEFGTNRTKTRKHNVHNAFGRGFSLVGVEKNISYKTLFGAWTGNRHTVAKGTVAGNALYPAAFHGRDKAIAQLEKVRDDIGNLMAQAGD